MCVVCMSVTKDLKFDFSQRLQLNRGSAIAQEVRSGLATGSLLVRSPGSSLPSVDVSLSKSTT